jgi:hypothetical protein
LSTIINASCHIQARAAVSGELAILRDGTVVENKAPQLGRKRV